MTTTNENNRGYPAGTPPPPPPVSRGTEREPEPEQDAPPSRRCRFDAAELMRMSFPEPNWAVPGIIAEGLTLLVGAPKLGKSWMALNLAVAISAGGKAFGKIDVARGTCLYLALEDPPRRLQQRLKITLEGAAPSTLLAFATEWPLMHDGGRDQLDDWLTDHPDTRCVIIDVLARVRGGVSDREARYDADYRAMIVFKALADKHGIAIVVVHHTRKLGSEDSLDMVSGTHGLAGACDSVLVLKRSRGSADAMLHVTGRDVAEAQYAMRLIDGRWVLLDGPAADYDLGETRLAILTAVRAKGTATPRAVQVATGLDYDLVRQLMTRMVDDDQLERHGRGTYRAPSHISHNGHNRDGVANADVTVVTAMFEDDDR